jgi:hypothetical protein
MVITKNVPINNYSILNELYSISDDELYTLLKEKGYKVTEDALLKAIAYENLIFYDLTSTILNYSRF